MKPERRTMNFAIWTASILAGQTAAAASFVGLGGLALGVPAHKLLPGFLALSYCGFVLAPLLHWARLARARPRACAIRFGVGMFGYLTVFALALVLGAVKAGVLSPGEAITGYLPLVLPISVFGSVIMYLAARQLMGPSKPGQSDDGTTSQPGAR